MASNLVANFLVLFLEGVTLTNGLVRGDRTRQTKDRSKQGLQDGPWGRRTGCAGFWSEGLGAVVTHTPIV